MNTRQRAMREMGRWAAAALVATLLPGCTDEAGTTDAGLLPPDFYLTVKLETNFRPQAVDRLDVRIYDATVLLGEQEGAYYDGGISWGTSVGPSGAEELLIQLTGEHVRATAMEVSQDTYELDIPFVFPNGAPGQASFSVWASALWEDEQGELQEIGRGTGELLMPPQGRNPTTIEVECLEEGDWGWTCRTGCDKESAQCLGGIEECGSGSWRCVDDCCVEAE